MMKQGMLAGAGEILQYLVHEQNDNTIRFALRYPLRLDPQIMERAVRTLVSQVDVLHASFCPGNLEAHWRIHNSIEAADCFQVVEPKTGQPAAEQLETLACQAMLRPILPEGKAQLFCTLITGEQESWIVLNLSHLCVDGGDGRYLLEKLLEAYRLILETGSADGLEVKNGSRSAFQMYKELSGREYFSAMKPKLSGIRTGFPFRETDARPYITIRRLAPELVQEARLRGREQGASLNDILLTAAYRAFAEMPGVDSGAAISIMSMMDLRRHCRNGESRGLCNMSGSLPTVLEQGVRGDFTETLREISAQTREIKEDPIAGLYGMPLLHSVARTTPLWLLMKVAGKVYGDVMSMGLTNLGAIAGEGLELAGAVPVGGMFAGPSKKKPGMQVSAAGFAGDITLCCVGEYGDEDAALIDTYFERIEVEIKNYVENP